MLQEGGTFKALLKGSMPSWAVQEAGAPAEVWLDLQAPEDADSLYIDVIWVNKTATRLPEVQPAYKSYQHEDSMPAACSGAQCQLLQEWQMHERRTENAMVPSLTC